MSISSSFEAKVATVHRFVSVSHKSVASFRVPVLAVLDGPINGFEASLALSSDWRVATSGTALHAKQAGVDPFQVHEKILSLCRQDKGALPETLDDKKMHGINLVSSVTNTFTEALEMATQLAVTISVSPSDGVVNMMKLLRPNIRSEQDLAEVAVSFVKTIQPCINTKDLSPTATAAICWGSWFNLMVVFLPSGR